MQIMEILPHKEQSRGLDVSLEDHAHVLVGITLGCPSPVLMSIKVTLVPGVLTSCW